MDTKFIGNCSIAYEKKDDIPHPMDAVLFVGSFALILTGPVFMAILGLFTNGLICFISLMIIVITSTILFFISLILKSGCGVNIILKDENRECVENINILFSGDADKDANKVKDITDKYTKLAQEIIDNNKNIKIQKELCCNQYKEVMKKAENK